MRPDGTTTPFPPPANHGPTATLLCIAFRDGAEVPPHHECCGCQGMVSAGLCCHHPFSIQGKATQQVRYHCRPSRMRTQEMLQSWAAPCVAHMARAAKHKPELLRCVRWVDLSLVESWVMGLWPFRSIILAGGGARAHKFTAGSMDAAAVDGGRTSGIESPGLVQPAAAVKAADTAPRSPSSHAVPQQGGAEAQGSDDNRVAPEPLFKFGDATEIRTCLGMTNRLTGCLPLPPRVPCASWQPGSSHRT